MMTVEQLKNSILQLAMQGKLVEQRPGEGTGEELYKEIQVEKKRLIKEKRYKVPKPQDDLVESELPFEIPDNWRWCQVGDFFSNASGLSYKKGMLSEKSAEMVRILRGGNIGTEEYFFREDDQFIKKEYVDNNLYLKKGYMITPAVTSLNHIGKIGLIDQDYTDVVAGGFVLMLMPYFDNGTISKFLLYWFDTKEHRDACRGITHKSGQAFYNLSREKLMNLPVPFPPLAEQKRIVAKIEELMPLVEQYATASTKLNTLNATFPEMMKKSILQATVQGKLVPQDPNDEPASVLLGKIADEKKRLVQEGKIKKQKSLPEITEDEIPFDIPESWVWVRLGSLCDTVTGRLDANAQNSKGKYPFFTCGEEVYKTIDYSFDCDAILLGGNNAAGIYKMHRYCGKFNAYQRVYVISGRSKYELDYLYCVIKYWLPYLRTNSQGTTTRFIKLGQVTNMLVPMPPINEQIRILEKLRKIIPLLSVSRTRNKAYNSLYYPTGLTEL